MEEGHAEPRKPLLLPGVRAERRLSTSFQPTAVRRCTSDVTVAGQALARAWTVAHDGDRDGGQVARAVSSRHRSASHHSEEDCQVEQMVEELDRFMDRMRDEPDTLRSIVSRWPQNWDLEELKDLRRHRDSGLHAFEGPAGYKPPVPPKKRSVLKDTIFMPLGWTEMGPTVSDHDKSSPSASPSRQARFLRDDWIMGKQVLTDFSLIHLAVYCQPEQAVRHIRALLDVNADVNAPAIYHASFVQAREPLNSPQRFPAEPELGAPVAVTALHLAVFTSKAEVVKLLLSAQASPDSRATFDTVPDYTALHLAAAVARQREDQAIHEAAQPILDKRHALHAHGARGESNQVISLLLEANADFKAADLSGRSCLRMLFDLRMEHEEKWTERLDSVDKQRLKVALSAGASKSSEMELESSIWKGLLVRLPDAPELSQDFVSTLASQSLQQIGGQAMPLSTRDLSKLFRKDFRVVALVHSLDELFVDCQQLPSGGGTARARGAAEPVTYRFPRYCSGAPRAKRMSEQSEWYTSPAAMQRMGEWFASNDEMAHKPSENAPSAKFGLRQAWRSLGVVVQGYEHFERMLHHLRRFVHADKSAETANPVKRYSTSPNFSSFREEQEEDQPDNVPPRPATATGAFVKSRTTMVLVDDNPFRLMEGASEGASDVDVVLDFPLPPGARYKKSWIFRKGCLLHYAAYMVMKAEEEQSPDDGNLKGRQQARDDLQLVLDARADVHARAYYRGRGGAFCTTTALHMVTASGCCIAAAMLVKAHASVEVTSTMNGMPYYHPLHNAAYGGSVRTCRLLLKQRANPNTTNNEGRTGLHLAVKLNHIEIVRVLVEAKGNVVMRDRQMGAEKCCLGGLTPLDMCRRATRQYSEGERAEIMALLAPSFNGVNSFLFDLHNMAISSDAAIGGFLVDQALKLKSPEVQRAVAQLRANSVTERLEGFKDCHMSPMDYIASIIENAPRVGVRVLKCLLLADPDMEDNVRGALPSRANLKPRHQDSCLPWRRDGWFISPFLCAYQPDANRQRHDQDTVPSGREHWPCWLHREDEPDPPWHRDLAPAPGHLGRKAGDSDVQIKVLLLANAIDVRIMRAFARVSSPDVFAELVVQSLIGCTFDQIASSVTMLVALEEAILFLLFMGWSKVEDAHWRWGSFFWCVTAAIAIKEATVHGFCLVQYIKMGWPWKEFFLTHAWQHTFKVIRLLCLVVLVLETRVSYLLDKNATSEEAILPSDFVDEKSPRKLLGTNIVIQGMQIVLLLRNASPEAEFGRHILSIIHSFGRLWAMLVVMVCFFFSFSFAFFVMDEDLSWSQLLGKVYRGLLLADGDGLDFMEGKYGDDASPHGHIIEWFLSCLASFLFTICLLNISIAVFQTEYEKALKESYLHFWQHRAFLCMQTLLGPRWPWGVSELGPRARAAVSGFKSLKLRARGLLRRARRGLRRASFSEDEGEPMTALNQEDDEDAELVFRSGVACFLLFQAASVALFTVRLHAICSAVCLAISLVVLQALAVRTESMGASRCGKRFYLWLCYRADFSTTFFINEDVEKEDINDLRSTIEAGLAELKGIANLTAVDIGRRMEKLESRIAQIEYRLPAPAATSLNTTPAAVRAAAAEVQEVEDEMKAALASHPPVDHSEDSLEGLEWAAEHLRREAA